MMAESLASSERWNSRLGSHVLSLLILCHTSPRSLRDRGWAGKHKSAPRTDEICDGLAIGRSQRETAKSTSTHAHMQKVTAVKCGDQMKEMGKMKERLAAFSSRSGLQS